MLSSGSMKTAAEVRVAPGKGKSLRVTTQGWAHSDDGLCQGSWLSDHTGWLCPSSLIPIRVGPPTQIPGCCRGLLVSWVDNKEGGTQICSARAPLPQGSFPL